MAFHRFLEDRVVASFRAAQAEMGPLRRARGAFHQLKSAPGAEGRHATARRRAAAAARAMPAVDTAAWGRGLRRRGPAPARRFAGLLAAALHGLADLLQEPRLSGAVGHGVGDGARGFAMRPVGAAAPAIRPSHAV